MSRIKRIIVIPGFALLIIVMLFGCARLYWSIDEQEGGYIRLNVGDPGAKGIGVDYYDVTGVFITVYDPEEAELATFQWDAEEGPQSYLVQVNTTGTYEVVVTHISDDDGEVVEATETAEIEIEEMVITVIDIIPGAIGTIEVDGQPTGDPWAWLYDFWVQDACTAPYSQVLEIRETGTWHFWDRYDGTGGGEDFGTWYAEGDLLYIEQDDGMLPTEVTRPDEDTVIFVEIDPNPFYRRGTEPCGYVFDKTPIGLVVSAGEWTEGTISDTQKHLYSFQAPWTGSFTLSWKQAGDGDLPAYTADIAVSAYQEDQYTPIFEWEEMSGYYDPKVFNLESGDLIYIVVEGRDQSGDYGIRIMSP
jgi:hypothetical protein